MKLPKEVLQYMNKFMLFAQVQLVVQAINL